MVIRLKGERVRESVRESEREKDRVAVGRRYFISHSFLGRYRIK